MIDWLQHKHIPRALGMVFVYIFLFVVLGVAVSLIIPPIAEQVIELSNSYPFVSEKIKDGVYNVRDILSLEDFWRSFISSGGEYQEFVDTSTAKETLDLLGDSLLGNR